jgi:transcriptional regulator with XRE-family HTH domain
MKRIPSNQHERENAFGRSCVRLRKSMGLTQQALGRLLGISEQAIGHWERGVRSPKPEHLKRVLALCLQRHAFTPGREHEEAQQLWRAAGKPADFDAFWMQMQLAAPSASYALVVLKREAAQPVELQVNQETSTVSSRFDWGEALDVRDFYGREAERLLLEQWVVKERCQVVSVLGMGGIGKSALAVTLMHQVAPSFQRVVFRSVRDAPLCEDLLADCLQVLAPQPLFILPTSAERGIDLLLEALQARRCLLVLDNLETLLQAHDPESRFLPGYEDYGALLRRVAETAHQSCLLLTSRESPADLVPLEGGRKPVRALRLSGLDAVSCEQLLAEKDVAGATPDRERLIERYGGNPLALNIVAETIVELFGGEIAPFLEQGEVVFGSVRELLGEHFARLSATEQTVLLWLAILREPVSIEELLAVLVAAWTTRSGCGTSRGAATAWRCMDIPLVCTISPSRLTAAACSVGVMMAPCGCGRWSVGSVCRSCRATRSRSTTWPGVQMAHSLPAQGRICW